MASQKKEKLYYFCLHIMSQKTLEHFATLLDQYKQVAFPNNIDQELTPIATLDLLETIDHVKSIPDQVRRNIYNA